MVNIFAEGSIGTLVEVDMETWQIGEHVSAKELVFCKSVSRSEGEHHGGAVVLHEDALVALARWLQGSASCSIGHNVAQGTLRQEVLPLVC